MVKVWCEYDMGFSNIDDHNSVFQTMEEAIKALESVDWEDVEYNNYQEAIDDGLLTIQNIQ